jgi:hypothetical protein
MQYARRISSVTLWLRLRVLRHQKGALRPPPAEGGWGGLASLFLELAYTFTIVGGNVVLHAGFCNSPNCASRLLGLFGCFYVGVCCLDLEVWGPLVMVESLSALPAVDTVLLNSVNSTASL